ETRLEQLAVVRAGFRLQVRVVHALPHTRHLRLHGSLECHAPLRADATRPRSRAGTVNPTSALGRGVELSQPARSKLHHVAGCPVRWRARWPGHITGLG